MTKACFCLLLSIAALSSSAQLSSIAKKLPNGSYLVVAAFSPNHEDYAIRMTSSLTREGRHSAYGFDETRKFWYVYLDEFTTRDACVGEWNKLRKAGTFQDVWVYTIKGPGEAIAMPSTSVQKELVTEPRVETPVEVKKPDPIVTEVIENPKAAPVYEPQTLKNTPVFLSLFNSTNNEVVDGDVDVVNTETGKLITKVKGNNYITLPNPGTRSGNLTLINNTFGFRKEQLDINYKETERDTLRPYVTLVGNFYMINFGLIKIRKGDISTLYNVYFYNDAAIMLPDSKYQLNSLLQMMKDNPSMKIILHGHTNGNGRGKIIYMGQSQNFFTITKDVVSGTGSAKELSEARAETIKMFLVDQGIDDARIAVKGWGGSRMIHDKSSSYARKNIRVDVEVAED
jgi:outer membrane protein OmpA-like peptidoglycan-associated protein